MEALEWTKTGVKRGEENRRGKKASVKQKEGGKKKANRRERSGIVKWTKTVVKF